MGRYLVQVIGQQVMIEHESDDLADVRDELLRTRHLMGVVVDDAHATAPVLIPANAVRWITSVTI